MTAQTEWLADLTATELDFLKKHGFSFDRFSTLRKRYLRGELDPSQCGIRGELAQAGDADIRRPPTGSLAESLQAKGQAAIERGEVGLLILNGGMATRFGGQVKGIVNVFDNRSFLELKCIEAVRVTAGSRPVPVLLMNSFATAERTRLHLDDVIRRGDAMPPIIEFPQNIGIRLTPTGDLFRDPDGQLSFHGTGHGDLGEAVSRGGLRRFRALGGKYLLMSNVDNLLANLDPTLLGMHIESQKQISVELVPTIAGDVGGTPGLIDGKLQIIEAFRLPDEYDHSRLAYLNTNTLWFSVDAFEPPPKIPYYAVAKSVHGRPAIQFERLVGEMTAHRSLQCVLVSREGLNSRFLPLKRPEDLEQNRTFLKEVLSQRLGF